MASLEEGQCLSRLNRPDWTPPVIHFVDYTSDEQVLAMLARKEDIHERIVEF